MYNYRDLIEDNKKLKDTILELEAKLHKLNEDLLLNYKSIQEVEYLNSQITKLEDDNKHMREQLISKEMYFQDKLNDQERKFHTEINRLNHELGIVNHKYNFITKLSTYVKSLEELNQDLVAKIRNLEEKYTQDLTREENKNKLELDLLKKKTLDILTSAKKHAHESAVESLHAGSKLTMLQNLQLRNELANQSEILEGMIEQMSKKEILIKTLQIDLETNKEVQHVLTANNKKMVEMIKDYGNKNAQLEKELQNAEKKMNKNREKINNLREIQDLNFRNIVNTQYTQNTQHTQNSSSFNNLNTERELLNRIISTTSSALRETKGKFSVSNSDKMNYNETGHSFFNISLKNLNDNKNSILSQMTPSNKTSMNLSNLRTQFFAKSFKKPSVASVDTNLDTGISNAFTNTGFSNLNKSGKKVKTLSKRSYATILDSFEKDLKSGAV